MSDILGILEELREPHIRILVFLYYTRAALFEEIRRLVGRGERAGSAYVDTLLLKLKDLGLVQERRAMKRYRIIIITDRGLEVAKMILRLYKEMEEK